MAPLALMAGTASGAQAAGPHAAGAPGPVTVTVTGGALGDLTTVPGLSPAAFASDDHDYSVYCSAGTNSVNFTLTSTGATLTAYPPGGSPHSGTTVNFSVSAVENQAVVLEVPDASNVYWVRCLPANFPHLTVTHVSTAPAGWYTTGVLPGSPDGAGSYSMVLDSHGTPVWYQVAPSGSVDLHVVSHDVLSWAPLIGQGVSEDPGTVFTNFNLDSGAVTSTAIPLLPNDFHEVLDTLPNGHRVLLASPLVSGKDLSSLGPNFSSVPNGTVVDCVIQEVDDAGNVVFNWRASDHVSPAEAALTASPQLATPVTYNGVQAADIYHCNSVDIDQNSPSSDGNAGNVLLSMRNTSAVYLIGHASGQVIWKLGGNNVIGSPSTDPGEVALAVTDPNGPMSGQHNARFQAPGNVSVFDDETNVSTKAARAVEFAINGAAAAVSFEYLSPDGHASGATGSFQRYAGGGDNLIGWGFRNPSGFSEVDASGNLLFDVNIGVPSADQTMNYAAKTYRVLRYDPGALDIGAMRATAGQAPAVGTLTLGGALSGGPGTASWDPNRLDAFIRGTDNALYHRALDVTAGAWSAWENLGGVLTSSPAAVSTGPNAIDVFVRGSDNQIWQRSFRGGAWGPWMTQGGVLADTPAVASSSSGALDVLVMGSDNQLWHKSYNGAAWSGWEGLGGILGSAPGAASPGPDHLDVYVAGIDGNIWHRYFDGSSWAGWEGLGGGPVTSAPTAASINQGLVDLVVSGPDGNLQRAQYRGGWQPWKGLDLATPDNPSLVARDPGKAMELFITGYDGTLRYAALRP